MRAWWAPIVLAVIAVGVVAYVTTGLLKGPGQAAPATGGGEYVQGLKRDPGTFKERSLTVMAAQGSLGQPDVTIKVNAVRPNFAPNEIRVKKGQVVQLQIIGDDNGLADMPGVDEAVGLTEFSGHGFQILGPYDVWITGIRKGVTKEVIFKASEAGEFAFECTVFCSPYHYLMQGKLIVEER